MVTHHLGDEQLSLGDEAQAETGDLVATGISWGGQLLHLACFATAAGG